MWAISNDTKPSVFELFGVPSWKSLVCNYVCTSVSINSLSWLWLLTYQLLRMSPSTCHLMWYLYPSPPTRRHLATTSYWTWLRMGLNCCSMPQTSDLRCFFFSSVEVFNFIRLGNVVSALTPFIFPRQVIEVYDLSKVKLKYWWAQDCWRRPVIGRSWLIREV